MNIKVKSLKCVYGEEEILKDINFEIDKEEILIIKGSNGTGKSTLMNCIIGEKKIKEGNIYFNDVSIDDFKIWDNVGFMPQKIEVCKFPIDVYEFLKVFEKNNSEDEVKKIIKEFKLEEIQNNKIIALSGGQKKKVYMARAILNNPKLLVLDEPLSGVDESSKIELINIIEKLKNRGMTIVVVSHNYNYFKEIITHVLVLENNETFFGIKKEFEKWTL